jgi:hypothetical protein
LGGTNRKRKLLHKTVRIVIHPAAFQGVTIKITICTIGSRGDIQPYLALAVGLQQAGHIVTLAAPKRASPGRTG